MKATPTDISASMPAGVGAFYYDTTDSTNQLAHDAAAGGVTKPTWYIAAQQSAGRGRRGRSWVSEPGNLFASLLWRPEITPEYTIAIPFLTALAVRDTCLGFGTTDTQVKWPNDVLVKERKVSGILIESSMKSATELDYIIIGIGINLHHCPTNTPFPATSLMQETNQMISVKEAASKLAKNMTSRINAWNPKDFDPLRKEWTRCAWGMGKKRSFHTEDNIYHGRPIGLGPDGGLDIVLDGGQTKSLYAGDVFPAQHSNGYTVD